MSTLRRDTAAALGLVIMPALAGCGMGTGIGSNSDQGNLAIAAGLDRAPYIVLDLPSGVLTPRQTISDLESNPVYRTTSLVWRLAPAGTAVLGSATGSLGAQANEPLHTVTLPDFYCAVFLTTQAQWTLLGGGTPWSVVPASAAGTNAIGAALPAFGISEADVSRVLAAYNASHHLDLLQPSDDQWEYAARGGATTIFSWGASPLDAAPNAVLVDTGATGPAPVGSLAANGFGFYDMSGDMWELSASGNLRGGAWNTPVLDARPAAINAIDPTLEHPTAGVRLLVAP